MTKDIVDSACRFRGWSGSAQALVQLARDIWAQSEHKQSHISAEVAFPGRIVESYRAARILSPAQRKQYEWPQLLQLLATRVQAVSGWTRSQIAETYAQLRPEDAITLLRGHVPLGKAHLDSSPLVSRAELAVQKLASGLVQAYRAAKSGATLVHDNSMPLLLAAALRELNALSLLEGREQALGSVHDLVNIACRPIGHHLWHLDSLQNTAFKYSGLVLLDPTSFVPTLDCLELAKTGGTNDEIREVAAFRALRATAEQFGDQQTVAYARIRSFVIENPITTNETAKKYLRKHSFLGALSFLLSCYSSPQPHHLIEGRLHPCVGCNTPLSPLPGNRLIAECTLLPCRLYGQPQRPQNAASLEDSLVVLPHILTYWVGPGLDEIALYRLALEVDPSATLYPYLDVCDLSLDNGQTGVDVKSHANPFVLGDSIQRMQGGLKTFPVRWLVVNDGSCRRFPGYLEIVRAQCRDDGVQVMSVSDLREKLESAK